MNKNRILKTACKMFGRFGLRSISVDDICHSIGIAKKTFYLFYSNKDELVRYYIQDSFSILDQKLQEILLLENVVEKLKLFDTQLIDFMMVLNPVIVSDLERYHVTSYRTFTYNRCKLVRSLVDIIELGKRQGIFRKSCNAKILAELRFDEIESILSQRSEITLKDLQYNLQQLFDHYVSGLLCKGNYLKCPVDHL